MTSPAAPGSLLRVDVVHTRTGIDRLEPEWSRLHQADSRANGWTEPHLLVAFDRAYFPAHRPRVLVVRDHDGTVQGILPLALEARRVGPLFLRRIVSMAGTQTSYPDAVVAPGAEASVVTTLVRALARLQWDELRLRWVEPGAHLLHTKYGLASAVPELRSEPGDPLWLVDLREPGGPLRHSAQMDIARCARRLRERGELVIGWEPPERLALAARQFVEMHTRLKRHQKQIAFYAMGSAGEDAPRWLQQEHAAGRAGLFTIRCDGTLIAGEIILRHRGVASNYRTAWDPEWAPFGPGMLLAREAMAACRERGDRTYDMGPGVEPYKEKWAPRGSSTVSVTASRSNWRTGLAARWLALRNRSGR